MTDERMQVVMGLIIAGGNAKNHAMEAITAAKQGDFELAEEKLKEANEALVNAHNVQTEMLTKEAQGEHTEIDLYMVHAQDHLMTGITFVDLAKEIIAVYRNLAEIKA
ncbi:PTS lactose/cellobiose transporter subunit IIA [Ligilactobacillus faecis]|uniref:PTS lactose/cellobiose transporter subunit IIA n=1 Tax=Ligilactobacillus faecis TaxID=762833 RepID=A0ABV4DUP8_9LACO|nr:PTS lactose/cellobiose transporter subunit IIA [Ligilactobacillus faecis]WGN90398.1 PTS lactose/cellobiose transporter subunit IIA [Ligilactobacillus faecis]